ncbi:MAG TPA: hypothetical protein VFT64_11640 [Rickettsiales bacterium]|nr:hypothetical protein [Rickettsiales bacterium]
MKIAEKNNIPSMYSENHDDVVVCLEFLANDAVEKNELAVHRILRKAIDEVNHLYGTKQPSDLPFAPADILIAFKLFRQFCLTNDASVKAEIVKMVEEDNKELFNHFTH